MTLIAHPQAMQFAEPLRLQSGASVRDYALAYETYGMLNAESQSARGEVLEIAIVALIVIEIVLSFFR